MSSWLSSLFCCRTHFIRGKETGAELQEYCDKLAKIYNSDSRCRQVTSELESFFSLRKNAEKLRVCVSRLQRCFRRSRTRAKAKRLLRLLYSKLGFVTRIAGLPDEILVKIFTYIPIKERLSGIRKVSRRFCGLMNSPLIWKHVDLSP